VSSLIIALKIVVILAAAVLAKGGLATAIDSPGDYQRGLISNKAQVKFNIAAGIILCVICTWIAVALVRSF
jgi:hypothetical protein